MRSLVSNGLFLAVFPRRSIALAMALALSLLTAGCSSLPRTPYAVTDASSARVLDLSDLRRYADEPASTFRLYPPQAVLRGPRTYLALSGGGAEGAAGARVRNRGAPTGRPPAV